MDYNKAYKIGRIGIIIGFFIMLIGFGYKTEFIGYTGLIVVVGSAIFEAIFYRCPKCNESLSIRGKKIRYCPGCGYKLSD